jgi:hypothetical protein
VAELERDRKQLTAELPHQARIRGRHDSDANDSGTSCSTRSVVRRTPSRWCERSAMGPCVVLAMSPSTRGLLLGASESSG